MSTDIAPSAAGPSSRFAETIACDTSDPATALLALMLQSRGVQSDAARENVNHANDLIEQARRQIQDAMARAAEADDRAGIWDSLGQVFEGDVAAIAEVVAVAALMAAGGPGATAILALVSAGLSVGADVGERLGLDPKLCAGLAVTGALAGLFAGKLDTSVGVWADIANGAKLAQAGATGVGAGAHIAAAENQAEALDAGADATMARGAENDAVFRFNVALDALASASRDLARGATAASSIVQNDNDGRAALIARIGAA